jgi:hypothetical protein
MVDRDADGQDSDAGLRPEHGASLFEVENGAGQVRQSSAARL